MSLPAPSGQHGVGCITLQLDDASRPSHLLTDAPGRSLFVKLWYPAAPVAGARPEMAWQSLRQSARTPAPMRAMLALLRRRVAACAGAPLSQRAGADSVVIYNHGMVSFAEENVSLMEALASEGHIVIAIEHHAQMAELKALNARRSPAGHQEASRLARELVRATPAQRAVLAPGYYAASPDTARIVRERARDTLWVMDQMPDLLARIPGHACSASVPRLHVAGFSVGGAVATEVALRDARACAVVNIDGGTQGSIDATALSAPCLMLYSEGNAGMNDALLPAATRREVIAGTRHLNLHDFAGLMPGLRYTGALGRVDALRGLLERNQHVCAFIAEL